MKCPHCSEGVHEAWTQHGSFGLVHDSHYPDGVYQWDLETMNCPDCHRVVVRLKRWGIVEGATNASVTETRIIYPKIRVRPIPEQVRDEYREDFYEACAVLDLSPKASAALSRRLIQHILREKAKVEHGTLEQEIDQVITAGQVPSGLAADLHAVRQVGNFAAHPTKSKDTAAVVNVEPGEAEWLLDLVGDLLDHYIVSPFVRSERRTQLNEKLEAAGKPLLPDDEQEARDGVAPSVAPSAVSDGEQADTE